jgi:hypothetical protein
MLDLRIISLIIFLLGIMYLTISIIEHDLFRFIICILFFTLAFVLVFGRKWNLLNLASIIIFLMGLIYLYISITTQDDFRFIVACLHFTLSGLLFWDPPFLQDKNFK